MKTLNISYQENYAVIQLDRGTSNAINLQMLIELQETFSKIGEQDNVKGVVLSGKPNFFSAGLDVIELYDYNKTTIRQLFTELFNIVKLMLHFKKPIVCAITGHAPAGGCILAIASDYRIMAEGKYRIGLNEIPVGIIMPNFIFQAYAFWLGKGRAFEFVLEGKLMLAQEALEYGLVNEVVDAQKVEDKAIEKLQSYLNFSANTWTQSKLNMRKDLLKHYQEMDEEGLNVLLEQWWSKDTRAILGALVSRLTKK